MFTRRALSAVRTTRPLISLTHQSLQLDSQRSNELTHTDTTADLPAGNSSSPAPLPPTRLHFQSHLVALPLQIPTATTLRPDEAGHREGRRLGPRRALHEGNPRDATVRVLARQRPDPRTAGRRSE